MPVYEYTCDNCGSEDSEQRSMADSDKRKKCVICKKFMRRNFQAEAPGRGARYDTYPFASDALGGHPDDRARLTEEAIAAGVPTEINSDGNPIMRSAKHRQEYCKALGFYDRNAGYSDQAPVNR